MALFRLRQSADLASAGLWAASQTELLIERALDRLLHGRTSIIIAHRLSTARRADRIVVIDRGDIAGGQPG